MALLLDLFCGAGGAAMGYHRAGFRVIGVDIKRQRSYPFEFHQMDALEALTWNLDSVDVIHASPPCQAYSLVNAYRERSPNLVPLVREALERTGKAWVIENVPHAPLRPDVTLCGSMFGLFVRRHRVFESNRPLRPLACRHKEQAQASPGFRVYRHGKYHISPVLGAYGGSQGHGPGQVDKQRQVMGVEWMSRRELVQAIPPAYTEYIGKELIPWVS